MSDIYDLEQLDVIYNPIENDIELKNKIKIIINNYTYYTLEQRIY